jgi:hypothetical protein
VICTWSSPPECNSLPRRQINHGTPGPRVQAPIERSVSHRCTQRAPAAVDPVRMRPATNNRYRCLMASFKFLVEEGEIPAPPWPG